MRPTIDDILAHPFFSGFVPSTLPASAVFLSPGYSKLRKEVPQRILHDTTNLLTVHPHTFMERLTQKNNLLKKQMQASLAPPPPSVTTTIPPRIADSQQQQQQQHQVVNKKKKEKKGKMKINKCHHLL